MTIKLFTDFDSLSDTMSCIRLMDRPVLPEQQILAKACSTQAVRSCNTFKPLVEARAKAECLQADWFEAGATAKCLQAARQCNMVQGVAEAGAQAQCLQAAGARDTFQALVEESAKARCLQAARPRVTFQALFEVLDKA